VPICLLTITVTGTFLRVHMLGEWSFWGDEMFTVSRREDGFNFDLLRQSLSLLLIQMVTVVNGLSEWNARIVPALVGIFTVPVLIFIVKTFSVPVMYQQMYDIFEFEGVYRNSKI
jgi:hypothetical protein